MANTDETVTPPVPTPPAGTAVPPAASQAPARPKAPPLPPEIGGPKGPEPTRFGDWEQKGRATDF